MAAIKASVNERLVRALLIEDDSDDYFLIRELFAEMPGRYHLDWVQDYALGLGALTKCEHDICLLDYRLGARNGVDFLRESRAGGCKTPIIMLTGQQDRELDCVAMDAGATDFLEKSRLSTAFLERAMRYALQHQRYQEELERRVAERTQELADANAALTEADRRKDEFLAILAHELRGPLAPLRNILEIMQCTDNDVALILQARATMERQLRQLVRLVDDLLDVSRINRGRMALKREHADLASVIYQAVEACRPLADQADHELVVTLPAAPLHVFADAARLAQIFGNLLNNACKYTARGGKIELRAERQANDLVVTVKDTGIGIPADKLKNIFEMFTQIDQSANRRQDGLGIGLSLVKRLVEMHSGSITVSSARPGGGSEFIVRLPIVVDSAPPEQSDSIPNERPVNARRILIVDDNRDSATTLSLLLRLAGNETHTAHDGLEAVQAAAALRPKVVLLDIGLPTLNGYDVCRRIRDQSWGKRMVLIAISGWAQDSDRKKSSAAGFDGHFVKPVDRTALMQLIVETEARARDDLTADVHAR